MEVSEGIWGPVWRVDLRVDSGQFWVDSGSILGPYLRNLIEYLRISFIWPWVGALRLNIAKYGCLGGSGGVPV